MRATETILVKGSPDVDQFAANLREAADAVERTVRDMRDREFTNTRTSVTDSDVWRIDIGATS